MWEFQSVAQKVDHWVVWTVGMSADSMVETWAVQSVAQSVARLAVQTVGNWAVPWAVSSVAR